MLSSENPRKTQEPTRSPPGAHAKTVVKTHLAKKEPTGAHTIAWKNTGAHTFHPLGNIIIFDWGWGTWVLDEKSFGPEGAGAGSIIHQLLLWGCRLFDIEVLLLGPPSKFCLCGLIAWLLAFGGGVAYTSLHACWTEAPYNNTDLEGCGELRLCGAWNHIVVKK